MIKSVFYTMSCRFKGKRINGKVICFCDTALDFKISIKGKTFDLVSRKLFLSLDLLKLPKENYLLAYVLNS